LAEILFKIINSLL